jgi:polysaccharide biosynthesis/export protein
MGLLYWMFKFLRLIPLPLLALFLLVLPSRALPLSPGDRVQVIIPEGTEFAGSYVVNSDGALEFPYLGPVPIAGLEPEEAVRKISTALVSGNYFQKNFLKVNLQVLAWAPIQVKVQGAVFEPGRVLINPRPQTGESKDDNVLPGDANQERYLAAALRAAGGVRPDADVKHIRLLRGSVEKTIDLSGMVTGEPVDDIPLVAQDQIIIPTMGSLQPYLARPSQITPPGIKVFVSNLTVPASSNSSSAVAGDTVGISLAYGARFSQAVMAANCAGGTQGINANRYATLVRTDRITGVTKNLDRPIEDILRNSTDESNPLLFSGDGVACYDSTVTNTRDLFRTIAEIINPFGLLYGFIKNR